MTLSPESQQAVRNSRLQYFRDYWAANKDRLNKMQYERQKRIRAIAPDEYAAYQREYREKNREKINAKKLEYTNKNREIIQAKRRERYKLTGK